jgi:thiol reductant ABC exporter CydD subunit
MDLLRAAASAGGCRPRGAAADATDELRRPTTGALDRRLLRRARPVRLLLAADVAIGVAVTALVLAQATLLARVIAGSFAGATVDDLARPLELLLLAFAGRAVLAWAFEAVGRSAATSVLSQLRLALAERRIRDQPTAPDGAQSAELAASAVFGASALEVYFGRFLPQLVLAALVPVTVIAWIVPIDLLSAAIMIATLPLVPVFMILVGSHTARRTQERSQALTLLATHFLDLVRGLPTLRAFNRGTAQMAAIAERGDRYRRATIATLRLSFLSGAVLDLAGTLGVALVAVSVGLRLDAGRIGLESAFVILILAPELYLPLRNVGALYHASADGVAVVDRLLPLAEPSARRPEGGRRPPSPREAVVRLEHVSYAYPTRPAPVLTDVDLELHPGEVVALVGPTGSGKSTVAAVLLGLVEPTLGRVTVGGVDLAVCDLAAWRRSVAWVPQRPTLFRGSVLDNIRLGRPSAPFDAVREAARLAGADAFIRDLDHGYDTLVGDGGRTVSAGQRQRIALARALVRRAPFVVLDEPTANVDAATAETIGKAIGQLGGRRTVLVIAHAPDIAQRADRTVGLGAGRVTDERMAVAAT